MLVVPTNQTTGTHSIPVSLLLLLHVYATSSNHSSTGIGTSIGIYSRRRRRRLCLCLFICRRRINFVIKRCEVGMKYRSFRKSLNPKKEKDKERTDNKRGEDAC